ncbi:hypothetical protein G5C60_17555 [Streptomyces sp. HC44]|uniref:Uncharacterized protein n=2 Tax=Streptomyces scabichelini TaxID=2711217 RepID=A0A6G4V693_9ACTN|nr:hypothetical protein [Streptomyces scabichelini]
MVAGCGTAGERGDGASAAADAFTRALRAGDGDAACAALAPETRMEVERSAKAPCDQAIKEEELRTRGGKRTVDVYGEQARVVLTDDTLFLSHFASGWKVTAAGCRPRPQQPYQCEIKGG